jgi:hypothetical protein
MATVELFNSVKAQAAAFLIAALSTTVALAWNTAVQNYLGSRLKKGDGIWGQVKYALVLTAIAIAIVLFIARVLKIDTREKLF